jgi:superfamily II DNA/RNA helicase
VENTMSFETFNLHASLLKAVEKLEWTVPTEVQTATIPVALSGKDLKVCAGTGSGKTAAFLLPLLNEFIENPQPNTQTRALILVPTRELAAQVAANCEALAKFSTIKCLTITGGEEFKVQAAKARKNPEIIIGTPGRLVEHLERQSIVLDDISHLILDEADRMLDMGFTEDIHKITGRCPTPRNTWLFSATLNARGLGAITRNLLVQPAVINTTDDVDAASIIQQRFLVDDVKHKDRLLVLLLNQEVFKKALVFTNTRDHAERVGALLRFHKLRVDVLHGEKQQDRRNAIMVAFRKNALDIVVATDVAARGLDVEGMDLVINYDVPRSGDEYTHRIGRTGRAGATGTAISFVAERDWNLMASIERYLGIKTENRVIQSLKPKYQGPKKVKASGKAAGKKSKTVKTSKTKAAAKAKAKGKAKKEQKRKIGSTDGFGVIRKKPIADFEP